MEMAAPVIQLWNDNHHVAARIDRFIQGEVMDLNVGQ
jgi:hypothetical protein